MNKILVANRGEIALRIMRSAREMGIKTVAVFSEADRKSLHVRYADEAVFIGEAASSASYLVMDKIIAAAKDTGADAIHPGYGFLSENAAFARKVVQSGITFIGPSAESMEVMGSKLGAKAAAKKFNVPMVPGTDQAIDRIEDAKAIADGIGYPVLIKASAGGGGKGMRLVEKGEQFAEEAMRAMSEAKSAFGDGSVFIEKYIGSPRHVEIQVLGDIHGNMVYLFERECSVQRRHQKVVEEAPSSILTSEVRREMGECAVRVARAAGYYNAGTVEFLVDEHLNFYFLEMNTRLQVEHPVSEMITGVDLVKEQIRVARGERLSFTQDDLSINGHSIEVRVYAEDPSTNFLPDIGNLKIYKIPQGPGVRVDDGFEEGMDIPIYYDPMIAKLIVHGKDRSEAIERMKRAIQEYQIAGVATTLPFCLFVMNHEAFVSGQFDTHFVGKYFTPDKLFAEHADEARVAGMLVANLLSAQSHVDQNNPSKGASSDWRKNRLA